MKLRGIFVHELLIRQLVKIYPGRDRVVAVDHVDIDVQAGELLVLLGPSGCGKTTLLRCIAGLEEAQGGSIMLGGHTVCDTATRFNLPTHKRDIGMVFQNYSLWPHMTVQKNVEYPLRARGMMADKRAERVREVLDIVQCGHLAERIPAMLSGGQQQRIALARALVSKPAVMLLDEPLSNLDALLRVDLRAQLRAIHRELGFTGIYVTHDQTEAFNLGTRVAVMRAGRIEQLGSAADVYKRPVSEYVARFLGIRNTLDLHRQEGWTTSAGRLQGNLHLPDSAAAPLQIYIRPENLRLSVPGTTCVGAMLSLPTARVVDTLYSGGEVDYVLSINDTALYAKVGGAEVHFKPGDLVVPHFSQDDVLIYAGGRLL